MKNKYISVSHWGLFELEIFKYQDNEYNINGNLK